MRFEISHRGGTPHVVELPGTVATFGRDPGCDVVLNDAKCSRRHAIVEELPEGLVLRDAGSANGTHVNGKRVERIRLQPGDTIRFGDAQVRLLAEVGETVVVAPDDLVLRTSLEVPRPAAEESRPIVEPAAPPSLAPRPSSVVDPRRATARPTGTARRPATVTLLVALWALFVPSSVAAVLLAANRFGGGVPVWGLAGLTSLALAGLGTAMALGLRALAPWARHLQVAIAGFGLLACPFTLASATVLLYLTRPEVRAAFEGGGRGPREGDGTAETTFALSLFAMLILGLAITATAVLFL
ncbi:MAG TPA: FHA domain-containing protein [Vicinamibacteria bacterium]|nr:FHA domain-containing protein [Vicinamibacteria bacterium]